MRENYKEIRDFIGKCAGKKTSFDELYSKIMGEKFGVRKGVIPIFLANEIVGLQDTPIIYLRCCSGVSEVDL